MKKSLSVFVTILTIMFLNSTVFAEVYRDNVEIPAGAVAFADEVLAGDYNPGSGVGTGYDDPQEALLEPDFDASTGTGQVSLGDGGSIILRFTDNALTTSGNSDEDLYIFEVGEVEPGNVAISKDKITWIEVGSIAGSTSGVDIDAYLASGVQLWGKYSYVRITDANAGVTTSPYAGVDVDAVAAISSTGPIGSSDYPKAEPGSVQTAAEGVTVTLNGAYSKPPKDGSIIAWSWTQLSGTPVTITNASTAIATFTAPATAPEALTFQLTVTGDNDYTDSDTTIVNIISDGQYIPTAGITPTSQTAIEGDTVTLGSSSTDSDGTVQTFLWVQTSGTAVTLSSTTAESVTFTAPVVGASGDSLKFKLTVTDNDGLKNTATATVNIVKAEFTNTAPVADAGPNQTVIKGATVALDGTGSSDPDTGDTITYSWAKLSGPDVSLSDATSASPTFTAPSTAENVAFEFQLTVTDNGGLQHSDKVIINVTDGNTPPVADAGAAQTVAAGALVTLDGSASTDADDTVITSFFWQQLTGNPVTLSDPAVAQPTFTAPAPAATETIEFELTVTDSEGLKGSDITIITVNPAETGGGSDSGSCFINSLSL